MADHRAIGAFTVLAATLAIHALVGSAWGAADWATAPDRVQRARQAMRQTFGVDPTIGSDSCTNAHCVVELRVGERQSVPGTRYTFVSAGFHAPVRGWEKPPTGASVVNVGPGFVAYTEPGSLSTRFGRTRGQCPGPACYAESGQASGLLSGEFGSAQVNHSIAFSTENLGGDQRTQQTRQVEKQAEGEVAQILRAFASALLASGAVGPGDGSDALRRAVRGALKFHAKGAPRFAAGVADVGPEAEYLEHVTRVARASVNQPPGSAAALRNLLLEALHSSRHSTIPYWWQKTPIGIQPGEDVYSLLTYSVSPRYLLGNLEIQCGANDKLIRYVRAKDRVRQAEWERFVRSVEFLRDLALFAVDMGLAYAGIPSPLQVVSGLQWFQNIQNPDPKVQKSLTMRKETYAVMYDVLSGLPSELTRVPEFVSGVFSVLKFTIDQSLKTPPPAPPQLAPELNQAIGQATTEGAWLDRHDEGRRLLALGSAQLAAAAAAVDHKVAAIDQNFKAGAYGPVQWYMDRPVYPQDPRGQAALADRTKALADKPALINELRQANWQYWAISYWGGWLDPSQSPAKGRITCG